MTVHSGTTHNPDDTAVAASTTSCSSPACAPPASLAAALALLQTQLPEVRKAQTATVRSDKGSYSYQYAGLAAVSREILPVLGALGLSFVCRPTLNAEGKFVLAYRLLHTSGEEVGGEYPLPAAGTPQQIGSAVTYGRRYCLAAVTGLVAEDDDDGAAADATQRPARPARGRRPSTSDTPPTDNDAEPITAGQRTAIQAGFSDLGYGGNDRRAERLQVAAKLAGLDELGSVNDLTHAQARRVLDGIAERKRAQAEGAPA